MKEKIVLFGTKLLLRTHKKKFNILENFLFLFLHKFDLIRIKKSHCSLLYLVIFNFLWFFAVFFTPKRNRIFQIVMDMQLCLLFTLIKFEGFVYAS